MIALARRWGDLVAGVLAAAIGIVVVATSQHTRGPLWANVLLMLVYGGLLAARSRAPVPTGYGFLGIVVAMSVALIPAQRAGVVFFGLLLFAYSAGTSRERALAVFYMPCLLGAITLANVTFEASVVSDYIFPAALTLAAYGAGRNAVFRGALAAELHEAELRAEEAQAAEQRRAVGAERRRIAREMHDVVAHSISVMVVQAGGARRIIERDPQRASAAASAIERTGRDTLIEMRRLLGVMHAGEAPAELEPSPTLADLGALCRRHDATLRVSGHTQPLPSGLEVGAYRVVQEALEDVRRVTPGARAEVAVEWTPLALTIRIADDRPYAGVSPVGVRERADLYGGTAATGPRATGDGHQLEVRFPLHDAVSLGAP